MKFISTFLIILSADILLSSKTNRLNQITTVSGFNLCMLGIKHKDLSSPEPELIGTCEKWKHNSCCYHNISDEIDTNKTYGFSYNHCEGHPMSQKCMRSFQAELCFYECSPDLGPWIVKVSGMRIRQERFYRAPLCLSECEEWWENCRDDYTCVPNWSSGFLWKQGKNVCPKHASCQKISKIYGDAKYFCESIWDLSFRVAISDENCLTIGINGSLNTEKNYHVSKKEAEKIVRRINKG